MARKDEAERKDWWLMEKGAVNGALFRQIDQIEQAQSKTFRKFEKLAWLYNPDGSSPMAAAAAARGDHASENYIATYVDTIDAQISSVNVRCRFNTDDADWSTQRQAKKREYYANGIGKKIGAQREGKRAFKDCGLKGVGAVRVDIDPFRQIYARRLLIDNIFVANTDCREGQKPRRLHYREVVPAEELKARFPGFDDDIGRVMGRTEGSRKAVGINDHQLGDDSVVVTEGWRLPIGAKGKKGYVAGRHAVCIEGRDLLDEKYEKDHYPIAFIQWSDPDSGFYGIGLAERIVPIQQESNWTNKQKRKYIENFTTPVTYVDPHDSMLAVKTIGRAGAVVPVKGRHPTTVAPVAVSPDIWSRGQELRQLAANESGVNPMAAHGTKPAGIDAAVALREYKDQATQRWATQESKYEAFQLEIFELVLECGKELGKDAPRVMRRSRFGAQEIKWSDVDMGDVRVQIAAASDVSKTTAGRTQLAMELGQSGMVSKDAVLRMIQHPDTDAELSLYTASLEHIERTLEDGMDGYVIMPDPYTNLAMAVWRGTARLQKCDDDGAPDDVLDILRQYIDTAAWMLSQQQQPPAPMDQGALTGAGVTAANVAAA